MFLERYVPYALSSSNMKSLILIVAWLCSFILGLKSDFWSVTDMAKQTVHFIIL